MLVLFLLLLRLFFVGGFNSIICRTQKSAVSGNRDRESGRDNHMGGVVTDAPCSDTNKAAEAEARRAFNKKGGRRGAGDDCRWCRAQNVAALVVGGVVAFVSHSPSQADQGALKE
jgi:hypothetical protein